MWVTLFVSDLVLICLKNLQFLIIKGFQTIVLIFIVISTTFWPLCPSGLLQVFVELGKLINCFYTDHFKYCNSAVTVLFFNINHSFGRKLNIFFYCYLILLIKDGYIKKIYFIFVFFDKYIYKYVCVCVYKKDIILFFSF